MSEWNLTGVEAIDKRLNLLDKKVAKRVASKVITAGLALYRKEIRKRAPKRNTGILKKSVGSRFKKKRNPYLTEAKAGLNVGISQGKKNYAPHAHLVALGTKQRFAKSRNKKMMSKAANRGRMTRNDFVAMGARVAQPGLRIVMLRKAVTELKKEGAKIGIH